MIRIVRWHYLGSIAISTIFVVGALVASWSYQVSALLAASTPPINNIGGWAWSGNSGWISLNSLNPGSCKSACTAPPSAVGNRCTTDTECGVGGVCAVNSCPLPYSYGLNLSINPDQQTGTVSGYAWSSSIGWVCFGSTCRTAPNSCSGALAPPSGSCDITFACTGSTCLTGDPSLVGKKCAVAADCGVDGVGVAGTCSAATAPASCQEASSADLSGWARELNLGAGGWLSLSSGTGGGALPYGVQVKFDQCYSTAPPPRGSYVDCPVPPATDPTIPFPNNKSTVFAGYAWNANGTPPASPLGTGWVSFNETPEVLFPYLYGGGGDVFSGRNISGLFPPPSGKQNAQYLVHVGGSSISSHFVSTCADPRCKSTVPGLLVPATTSPGASTPYSFKLGRFDFAGLCSVVSAGKNKYGQPVVIGFPTSGLALGGAVYCPTLSSDSAAGYAGQQVYTTLGSTVNLVNGTSSPLVSGAGTIVVKGNLAIINDITYGPTIGALTANSQLASLTWIVLGDVRVDPAVRNLAGTFIVLGRREAPVRLCSASSGAMSATTCLTATDCTDPAFPLCLEKNVCDHSPSVSCVNDSSCAAPFDQKYCVSPDPLQAGRMCSGLVPGECGVGSTCAVCKPAYIAKDETGDLYSGYGKFLSCVLPGVTGATCDQYPLVVAGSVFARQFKLDRTYVSVSTRDAAEQFVSDGRMQLNPPPGMADFAKGLPTFSRQ